MFGGHWQPGSSPKLLLSSPILFIPLLAPKGMHGVSQQQEVPFILVESDKSASRRRSIWQASAAADVVAAILRNSQRGFTFSRRRGSCHAHARGPVNRALCTCVIYVIVANNFRSYTSTPTGPFLHTSVWMDIVNKVLSFPSSLIASYW